MTLIKDLTQNPSIIDADQLPIYDVTNDRTRRVAASTLKNYFNEDVIEKALEAFNESAGGELPASLSFNDVTGVLTLTQKNGNTLTTQINTSGVTLDVMRAFTFGLAGYSFQGIWEPSKSIPAKADRVDGYALLEISSVKIIEPLKDESFITGATFQDDLASGKFSVVTSYKENITSYEQFKNSANLAGARLNGMLFLADYTAPTGSMPTVNGTNLYIYDSNGVAFKHVNEWSPFIAESIGIENIQVASDYLGNLGGGVLKWSTNFTFNEYFVVQDGVFLHCDNQAEAKLITSSAKNYGCVYLRDNARMIGGRVNGGDKLYIKPTSQDKEFYNKVGITTQGSTKGKGQRVSGVGFSRVTLSCVYVHDGHNDVEISGCYTYGELFGRYVGIDSENNITNINEGKNQSKLDAGTQGYCLLNFYNSGVGTFNVSIFNNLGVDNITDSFAAPNDGAYDHKIYGNTSKKTAAGYYGGYGLDFNNCHKSKGWGNTFTGYSVGAHFYRGGKHNQAFGNTYECAIGTFFEAASPSNKSYGNMVRLSGFGSQTDLNNGFNAFNASCGVVVSETVRARVSDSITSINTSTSPKTGSISGYSAGSFNRVLVTTSSAHNLRTQELVELINCGDLSGIWRTGNVTSLSFELLGSNTSSYPSEKGTFYSNRAGVCCVRGQGNVASQIWAECDFEDLGVGLWVNDGSDSKIYGNDGVYLNVPSPSRGENALTNNSGIVSGISSTGSRCKNFTGTAQISATTTETTVTFNRPEDDTNYKIPSLVSSPANINPFVKSKTTAGFVIGHDSSEYPRSVDWMIVR